MEQCQGWDSRSQEWISVSIDREDGVSGGIWEDSVRVGLRRVILGVGLGRAVSELRGGIQWRTVSGSAACRQKDIHG